MHLNFNRSSFSTKGRIDMRLLPVGQNVWCRLNNQHLAWVRSTPPHPGQCRVSVHFPTSQFLGNRRATISWIIPRLLPSTDMDLRRVSMASWLVIPSSDSPLTAMSWSLTRRRPSCRRTSAKILFCSFHCFCYIKTILCLLLSFRKLQYWLTSVMYHWVFYKLVTSC